MDDWKGLSMVVAQVRPDNGDANERDDYCYNEGMWSRADGNSWNSPVLLPSNIGEETYSYVSDGTVAFTDSGVAYVAQLGVNFTGDCGSTAYNRQAIFLTTTTDGASFTPRVVLARGYPGDYDHPWMDIDRAASPDRLHFAWWNRGAGDVEYRCLDVGNTCPSADETCCDAPCSSPPCLGPLRIINGSDYAGPPTLTVGGDERVYVSWIPTAGSPVRACRMNPGLTDCERTSTSQVEVLNDPLDVDQADVPIPPTSGFIVAIQGWTLEAAQSRPGVVYYVYHTRESGAATKDVYSSRGLYVGGEDLFTWSPPVRVATVGEDGTDQFNPMLTVNANAAPPGSYPEDTLVVSWYDRRTSCPGYSANRCMRRMMAVSTNGGLSWYSERGVQDGTLSDPWLLPFHCANPTNRRFVGDFQVHQGNALHSHVIYSAAPYDGSPRSAQLWQAFASNGHHDY